MAKRVLKWPLTLKANGSMAPDTSHQTGMRMVTVMPKGGRVGKESQGLSIAMLEQANVLLSEDRMLMLVTLLNDIADFIPAVNILGIDVKRISADGNPRTITIDVRYFVKRDISTIYSFQWKLRL